MREFRIECISLAKESAETAWGNIVDAAQTLLTTYAPQVDIRQTPGGWSYSQDEWHRWSTVYDTVSWAESGTLIFAALVALMLRDDPDLLGFAVVLHYRDNNGSWVECG